MSERTFAIIKPDAVQARTAGQILARIEGAGFVLRGLRLAHLTEREAEGFYAVHRARPFFGSLTKFMSSGPCMLMVLEADDAIRFEHIRSAQEKLRSRVRARERTVDGDLFWKLTERD
jgi:nucleoside diphosphate kinase